MKRVLMVLAAAALMAATIIAMAVPGFAAVKCEPTENIGHSCVGGVGQQGGGGGGQSSIDFNPQTGIAEASRTGGAGIGAGGPGVQQGGGEGGNADHTSNFNTDTVDIQEQGGGGRGGNTFEPDGGGGGQCTTDDSVLVEEHGSQCPAHSL